MRPFRLFRHSTAPVAPLFMGLWLGACETTTAPEYPTLVVSTDSLPRAVPHAAYHAVLEATGGNGGYAWSLATGSGPLPAGLVLVSSGAVAGTPSTAGVFPLIMRVTSADGQVAEKALSLTVPPVLQPNQQCADFPGHAIPTFADALVEERVRHRIWSQERQDGGSGDGWWPEPLLDLTCDVVAEVTELTVTSHPHPLVVDLAGAQNLTGLTRLNVVSTDSIANLGAISSLTALRILELSSCVEDLGPLAGLAGLERLDLNHNAVVDLEPLRGLASLTYLSLRSNQVSDLSPLSDVTALVQLDLGRNAITDIGPLSALTNLEELYLSENSITDIAPLSTLAGLRSLTIVENSISDLTPLVGLAALRNLNLDRNSVSDISPLAGLGELRYLRLSANAIVDLGPLGGLTNLLSLHLGANEIVDIGPLSGLIRLQYLLLSSNSLTDLTPLTGMIDILDLRLRNNPELSDIQPLLDNAGIGPQDFGPGPDPGDLVDLRGTMVSCVDIEALKAKGANVHSDCP